MDGLCFTITLQSDAQKNKNANTKYVFKTHQQHLCEDGVGKLADDHNALWESLCGVNTPSCKLHYIESISTNFMGFGIEFYIGIHHSFS